MITMEMIVNMDCQGCERKVRKALQKLDGVKSIEIDMNMQKVTVTGWVDQEKVLKRVRRTGKKAELWPFPNNAETIGEYDADMYRYQSDPSTYFHSQQPADNYYYYEHGHLYKNEYDHDLQIMPNYYHSIAGVSERASTAFSDENVNACSVM